MMYFNETFNKKEKPVFTGITRGIGGFGPWWWWWFNI